MLFKGCVHCVYTLIGSILDILKHLVLLNRLVDIFGMVLIKALLSFLLCSFHDIGNYMLPRIDISRSSNNGTSTSGDLYKLKHIYSREFIGGILCKVQV